MTFHIIPLGELEYHQDSMRCRCHPDMERAPTGLYICHYSIHDKMSQEEMKKLKYRTYNDISEFKLN